MLISVARQYEWGNREKAGGSKPPIILPVPSVLRCKKPPLLYDANSHPFRKSIVIGPLEMILIFSIR